MAEAEDVLADVARHATIHARALWQRHRRRRDGDEPLRLADVAPRLDLLLAAAFGRGFTLRAAQPPAPATFLTRLFQRNEGPRQRDALPATDGTSLWLPAHAPATDPAAVVAGWRLAALRQGMRALRGSAALLPLADPLLRDLYLLCEAASADRDLLLRLPGLAAPLRVAREAALAARPAPAAFPPHRALLEAAVRQLLGAREPPAAAVGCLGACPSPVASREHARTLAASLRVRAARDDFGPQPLLKDGWTGELRAPSSSSLAGEAGPADATAPPVRSARLPRRPDQREDDGDEDDRQPGAWMVQSAQPHEQAEDPHGLQRPVDRDDETSADEFADALSELAEARLVSTPGAPKEVLLSDDPPDRRSHHNVAPQPAAAGCLTYPEWDWTRAGYDPRGATVHLLPAADGPLAWVEQTLAHHRGMLADIRRRFEMLRARRVRVRRLLDGDDIDIDALVEAQADFHAGLPLSQRIYQAQHRTGRDLAILLLVDASGSTDGWIAGNRRVIDVEREALLLVCIALEGLSQPYAVQSFSGEGPHAVVVREVKRFDERYGAAVARRIAGLEPERWTRAGAAMRHATCVLMRQAAPHRLLVMLSDGKPNDIDRYEGRYGVEDLRQAVTEARLQGIAPFCLTIDRHAANYLPQVFGAGNYALLPRPELLPSVLLDWLRRLVAT